MAAPHRCRFAADRTDQFQSLAKELVALQPDVILAHMTPVVAALQRESSAIPIVFTGKWLAMLREIAPRMGRVAISDPEQAQHGGAYSITSSARATSMGGISRPSALAVLRLMISSNFVGCSIGRSAGFAPLITLTTNAAARLVRSGILAP